MDMAEYLQSFRVVTIVLSQVKDNIYLLIPHIKEMIKRYFHPVNTCAGWECLRDFLCGESRYYPGELDELISKYCFARGERVSCSYDQAQYILEELGMMPRDEPLQDVPGWDTDDSW